MRLVIISGRSGAGKSIALHALEDAGFNCIDNLPVSLLPALIEQINKQSEKGNLAICIDARNRGEELQQFPQLIAQVRKSDLSCEVLFLDARTDVLIRRYSETRRRHPLSNQTVDLTDAITRERTYLEPIIDAADLTIDTTALTLHQLRSLINERIVDLVGNNMALQFQSFGFKHSIPIDADLVFDVRCLPNPYWVPELRGYTGQDQPVIEFLENQTMVTQMYEDIKQHLTRWLPEFIKNNRSYFTVAIGCTGGQHRSVYLSEKLYQHFSQTFDNSLVRHRELGKSH